MAKLNSKQTREIGIKAAQAHPAVTGLTLEQIEAMDGYDARRTAAQVIFDAIPAESWPESKSPMDFKLGFVDAAQTVWARVVKDRDAKRQAWKRALGGITVEQMRAKVDALYRAANLRGSQFEDGDYRSSLRVRRGWGLEADISVRFEADYDRKLVNFENVQQAVYPITATVEVSWSSSGRSLAQAMACITLYEEVVRLAAEVEVLVNDERVIRTYGIEEPAETAGEAQN
jgi:hypothetical protein